MKTSKGSSVNLIAILASGLSVAMQAGAFEIKTTFLGECYFEAVVLDVENSCTHEVVDQNDPCSVKFIIENDPILSLGATFTPIPLSVCPGGAQFCCLEVVANPEVICNNPIIDPAGSPVASRYRVTSDKNKIYCQPSFSHSLTFKTLPTHF